MFRPSGIPGEQTYQGAVRWARRHQLQGLKQLRRQPGLLELLLLLHLHQCLRLEEQKTQSICQMRDSVRFKHRTRMVMMGCKR